MLNRTFWKNKRVLVTGHTGFKGGWLSAWLLNLGATVSGYALLPSTEPSFFELCGLSPRMKSFVGDIRDGARLYEVICEQDPEIIFHLAAQSLVRNSYADPVETFSTNVMGTVNLFEAVRRSQGVRAVINVTSDKCYESKEWIWGYRENEPLGGDDPYSASKACAELVTKTYRESFLKKDRRLAGLASVRAGNVIGGGDWAQDRIVPDAVRALSEKKPLVVRNPNSTRPWQHVLEPLTGYLMLAERLSEDKEAWGGPWNFGPNPDGTVTVAALADHIVRAWGSGEWVTVPEARAPKETRTLHLDSSKARELLRWKPKLGLPEAVDLTVDWYKNALLSARKNDLFEFSIQQIENYERVSKQSRENAVVEN